MEITSRGRFIDDKTSEACFRMHSKPELQTTPRWLCERPDDDGDAFSSSSQRKRLRLKAFCNRKCVGLRLIIELITSEVDIPVFSLRSNCGTINSSSRKCQSRCISNQGFHGSVTSRISKRVITASVSRNKSGKQAKADLRYSSKISRKTLGFVVINVLCADISKLSSFE